jgi:hypothetical protein
VGDVSVEELMLIEEGDSEDDASDVVVVDASDDVEVDASDDIEDGISEDVESDASDDEDNGTSEDEDDTWDENEVLCEEVRTEVEVALVVIVTKLLELVSLLELDVPDDLELLLDADALELEDV